MEIGFSLERGRGDPSWYGGEGGCQSSFRVRVHSFEAADLGEVRRTDRGRQEWHFCVAPRALPFPPHSRKWTPLPFSLGVSDYSARIKSCLLGWLLVQRSSAGAGSGYQLWLWLVIEPFPLRFPKSQPRGEEEEEEEDVGRRREEDEDFFSKFALMTPPS